ncbi:MAG TPA: hypothetical protein VN026_04310 [Bacteroidia bacterium]|jgi:hypothetical protein|nr:hypothetical protein [Bacteroidia bacterium]
MKEKLQEIYEGLKERLKSPFILTFILVWSIHHWRLLFHLFTFDDDASQSEKYFYINSYFTDHNWNDLFWWPVFYATCSFIGYLIAALVFESITEIYDRWGRTAVLYAFNRNKTVKREELEATRTKLKEVEKSYFELDKMYSELETELQEIEGDLDEEVKNHDTLKQTHERISYELQEHKNKLLREDEFIYHKTREALFQMLLFYGTEQNGKKIKIKIQSLFLGKWFRTDYNGDTRLGQKNSEHELNFSSENVTDIRNEFIFNVVDVLKVDGMGIYHLIYKNKADLVIKELLFKVTSELFIGRIIDEAKNDSPTFTLIEYRKVIPEL